MAWEGYRESRRYSRDTYPEAYVTKYTNTKINCATHHLSDTTLSSNCVFFSLCAANFRAYDSNAWLAEIWVGLGAIFEHASLACTGVSRS